MQARALEARTLSKEYLINLIHVVDNDVEYSVVVSYYLLSIALKDSLIGNFPDLSLPYFA